MGGFGKCGLCGKWVPRGDTECPHCGARQGPLTLLLGAWRKLFPPAPRAAHPGRFCASCQKLLGPKGDVCPHCGVRQTLGRQAARFASDLVPSGVSATHFAVGVYGLLFLLPAMAFLGTPGFSVVKYLLRGTALLRDGEIDVLTVLGANRADLLAEGEVWRLVTATFLHIGVIHLIFNASALLSIGGAVEELYGRGWTFALLVTTGFGGNVVAWSARGMGFANAGASGAVYGLIGVGIVHCWRHRFVNRHMLNQLIGWALGGIVMGLAMPVDNHAHVGGLVIGAALGRLMRSERMTRPGWRRAGSLVGAAAVVLVGVCFLLQVFAARKLLGSYSDSAPRSR